MSNLLNSLQQQFAVITADITNKLLTIDNSVDPEKKSLFSQIEQNLEETKELLEQIDLEIRGSKQSERKQHLIHLEGFRKEYEKLKNDFKNAKLLQRSDDSSVRLELFGDNEIEMDDSKTQLLSDTQRLEASQRKLESGYKLCVETEQIGSQILENLNSQRDTIKRSRDKLRSTNYELGRSSRILNLMTRKAMQTKALIYFIAFVIFLFLIYLIYDSFVH